MASTEPGKSRVLNFNVGVLGHIDSGKTSLSKALSTTASTASFDKNPQSRERGITLDLGFSSFVVPLPEHLKQEPYDVLQFTLVDCPGHASLIKTIIGGAQIIDLMILVVDVNKGIQTQTAECLVIGQITCDKMIVVLNKVDLIPEAKREQQVEKMKKRLSKTLESTKFSGASIVAVAAKPDQATEDQGTEALGINEMVSLLSAQAYVPQRDNTGSFLFSVDHCFSVRGQGTVMTGTVLQGSIALNDSIEIPSMKVVKKIKSMQMFRQPVSKATQGDRVGICVTQFDPKVLERGLVCAPLTVPTIIAGIVSVEKIHYYKGPVASKAKFHITVGHDTVMGKAQFFGLPASVNCDAIKDGKNSFDFSQEYVFQDELLSNSESKKNREDNENSKKVISGNPNFQYAVLELEKPVTCPNNSLVIGSRLDTDIHLNSCRLAFHGKLLTMITDKSYVEDILPKVKIFKTKSRVGEVERVVDENSVVGKGLFKKETNMQLFSNLKVRLSTGEHGVIEGSFGQSGKCKIRIPGGLSPESFNLITAGQKKKGKGKSAIAGGEEKPSSVKIILDFKRYIFDPKKTMIQT